MHLHEIFLLVIKVFVRDLHANICLIFVSIWVLDLHEINEVIYGSLEISGPPGNGINQYVTAMVLLDMEV